jgi:prophage antirepressor-like protein
MSGQRLFQRLFHDSRVTSIYLGGEVVYNAIQMGEKLELSASVVRKAVWKMTGEERLLVTNAMLCRYAYANPSSLRIPSNRGQYYLRKPGVYELVFRSRAPEAEEFTDWLCAEVIPTIVHHGAYDMQGPTKPCQKTEEQRAYQNDLEGIPACRSGDPSAVFSFLRAFGFDVG